MSVAIQTNLTAQNMNQNDIQMVPVGPGLRLYKPFRQPQIQSEASLSMGMVEHKTVEFDTVAFVPVIINESETVEESETIEQKLLQQFQQLFTSESPASEAAEVNVAPKSTHGWGTLRAPLRDYERLMTRVRFASGAVTRAALTRFIGNIPEYAENPAQTREKNLAQLLLDYFEVIQQAGRNANTSVIEWSDVLAIAERADDLMGQKAGNPYILGLSDAEFERVKVAQGN